MAARKILPRRQIHVATSFGTIEAKVVTLPGGEQRVTPEYADCQRIAAEKKIPVSRIYAAALQAALDQEG